MIKAVLFDLDGTVINTNELVITSWRHALGTHLGRCPEDTEIIGTFGEPLIVTAKRYDENNAEAICETYKRFNISVHDEMIKEYEGMEDTIKNLKKLGLKVGIVTSKRKETAMRALRMFKLLELMDVIITFDDCERHKPHPEPLLKGLEVLGISPLEAMYVGDSHYDILCGQNAGCRTCVVKYSAMPFDELMKYKPDYSVDKPLDIVELVKGKVISSTAV